MLYICIILLMLLSARAWALRLTKNGKTDVKIVAGRDATEPEKTAARELAAYLKKISGADFKVTSRPSEGVNIYVGQTKVVKALVPGFDWDSLKRDGILIKTGAKYLILAGDRPRGTLYAVYTFLEEYLGVRFLTAEAETVPENRDITLPGNIKKVKTPDFFSREAYYKMNMANPVHAVKLKLNGHNNFIPEEWGGHCELIGFAHTFGRLLLRKEDYYEAHPEWYAEIDGKRVPTQPCLSNTEMLDQVAANVLRELDKRKDPQMISITQNDNESPCRCEKCRALVEKYGSESGILIHALNYIYDKVKDRYPDVLLETFAYQYTVPAPTNIKPVDNVIIRLCDIENNFGEPIEEKSKHKPYRVIKNCRIFPYADQQNVNADFYGNLEAWGRIAKNLFIWNYTVNFNNYYIIHPNFHSLKPDVQSFRKHHACAVFEQGDCFNMTPAFNALKNYLIAHLLWDPDIDDDAVIRDFMQNYYGPCWRYLYEVICGCERLIRSRNIFLSTYMNDVSWMNTEEMIYFFRLFRLALDASEGVYRDRIENELMFFQTGWFTADEETKKAVAESGYLPISDEAEYVKAVFEHAKKTDNAFYSESRSIDISPYAPVMPFKKEKGGFAVEAGDFILREEGTLSALRRDPKASGGKAAVCLPSDGKRCMVRDLTHLVNELKEKGAAGIKLTAVCRLKKAGKGDDALQVELWDPFAGGTIFSRLVKASELSGDYCKIDLGERKLWQSRGCGLYLHSCGGAEVYIDKLVITKVK